MSILAFIIGTSTLYQAKRHDGLWPAQGYDGTLRSYPVGLGKTSTSLQEDKLVIASSMRKAADKNMTVRASQAWIHLRYIAESRENWNQHAKVFKQRYNAITPAHLNLNYNDLKSANDNHPNHRQQLYRYTMTHLYCMSGIALTGICVAFTTGRMFWFCAGTILLSSIILIVTPLAPPAIIPYAPIVNTDTPALFPISRPAPDFTTPEKVAQSVFDAAAIGDVKNFRKGLSSRLNIFIESRNLEEHLLERFRNNTYWVEILNIDEEKGLANIRLCNFTRSESGWNMILEEGEWRLDDLPIDLNNF